MGLECMVAFVVERSVGGYMSIAKVGRCGKVFFPG